MAGIRWSLVLAASTLMLTVVAIPRLHAQVPDKFTNLKILPKNITKQDLTATMRSFASSLGVRCGYCHVRPGGAARDVDWASDAKPEKVTARVMARMARHINDSELPKITTKHPDKVEVRCRTCHHGEPRPLLIEDVLTTAYETGGLDSLTAKYEGLKKKYYGTDTYNFGADMLPDLAERLAADPHQALRISEYNAGQFPDSGQAHLALGEACAAAGDNDRARTELEKAAALDPSLEEDVQRVLGRLKNR